MQDLPGNEKRYIQKAVGIEMTIVNGQVLVEKENHTGAAGTVSAAVTARRCRRRRKSG